MRRNHEDISMKGFTDVGDEVLHGDGGESTNGHIWYVLYTVRAYMFESLYVRLTIFIRLTL